MTHDPESTTVLVTGASSFIASHCVLQLLQAGYSVRGTLRDPAKEDELRKGLARHVDVEGRLEFVVTNLERDEGWNEAAQGCDFILHVASPVLYHAPKHEDEMIVPAREGTLRVLRAAVEAGVRRVVITSSLASITSGHEDSGKIYDEEDWANLNGKVGAYEKSKTIAERAAWDFVNGSRGLELSVINPGLVLGPSVDGRFSVSSELVKKLMLREAPGTARLKFFIVDVRDVADAHLRAMTSEWAAGNRYIAISDERWVRDVALVLHEHFADRGYRVPTRDIPDFMIRLVALFDETIKLAVPELSRDVKVASERIRSDLNWKPRPPEESIIATAESMIEYGVV